jgi:hypothetical protein
MIVAVHQPNYLPWCGFFAKMLHSDVFILLDDAQIPQGRSYVSRTRLRGGGTDRWYSVPVSSRTGELINTVRMADPKSLGKQLRGLEHDYRKAASFASVFPVIEAAFADPPERLAPFNERLIRAVADLLGIETRIVRASDQGVATTGDQRLVDLVRGVGGETYLSGQGGNNYQKPETFEAAGVTLDVRQYSPIAYEAPGYSFIPGLSILDALLIVGPQRTRELLQYRPAG